MMKRRHKIEHDILTKSLGSSKFQEMKERIGLLQITSKAEHKA
jgi:hypothetical protein